MKNVFINRLKSITSLKDIPVGELQWLVEHSDFSVHDAGSIIAPKGEPIKFLYIILSGKIISHIDRGAGARQVIEWETGAVTGMLPYSRMSGPPGDNVIDEKTELLMVDVKYFPEMIKQCPAFTAYTVHSMLDRARRFNSSDLQDEKMISLGKMASGLAHELNNPASATVRDAKLLLKDLAFVEQAAQELIGAGLTKTQLEIVKKIHTDCRTRSVSEKLTPIRKADYQDKITHWLTNNDLDPSLAEALSDTIIPVADLNKLATVVSGKTLNVILRWIAGNCSTSILAMEIEQAATQIYKLVDTVKKFTYMDNFGEKKPVNIESGIRDTVRILLSRIKSKNADISVETEGHLPPVYAIGSELNQVWFSLLDNALDAIPESGHIKIKARSELNRIFICFIDNGPGISGEVISRIFDPFFTTKAPGYGTGLGLEIARQLLHRYKGTITVQSVPGRTEFQVNLPAANSSKSVN